MESRVLEQKVHYFEHYSIEKFEEYFRGAYNYVINILFDKMIGLVKFRYFKDEILLISESLIQSYFVFKHDATYAEFFYNFKRFHQDGGSMSKKYKMIVVILQTLIPYIKTKLDRIFNDIQAKIANHDVLNKQSKLFREIYPFIVSLFRCVNLIFNAKYLLNPDSKYFSLDYYLVKTTLSRVQPLLQPQQKTGIMNESIEFIKRYFIFGLFLGFQGLDWYYRSMSQSQGQKNGNNSSYNEAIPPPINISQQQQSRNSLQSQSFCILCKNKLKNASVLSSSGYVFCYTCISDYVKNHKMCPVTQVKSEPNMIVKLYISNS